MNRLIKILGLDVIQKQNKEIIDLLEESNRIAKHALENGTRVHSRMTSYYSRK
jgi:hypothetical protein